MRLITLWQAPCFLWVTFGGTGQYNLLLTSMKETCQYSMPCSTGNCSMTVAVGRSPSRSRAAPLTSCPDLAEGLGSGFSLVCELVPFDRKGISEEHSSGMDSMLGTAVPVPFKWNL